MNDTQARFCTSCGTQLTGGAAFCTSCGSAVVVAQEAAPSVAAEATTPPQPPAPPAEPPSTPVEPVPAAVGDQVVAIVPNAALKSGFMGIKRTSYTLALTRNQVLCAEVTSAMLKQSVADARDDAKADGKGFFGQWGAQLTAYSKMAERYYSMSPAQILAENPGNFAIERSQIEKAKLKAGMAGDENTGSSPDRLIIKTQAQKYAFDLGNGMSSARQALIEADLI